MTGAALRAARVAAGLSQAQLAERAGVSRQLVSAVEAGRHLPRVDAALGLATALGSTTEALFGAGDAAYAAESLGLATGSLARAARVGRRLVCVPLPDHGIAGAEWASADAIVRAGTVELLPRARTDGLIVAGCEPALGLLRSMAADGQHRLLVRHESTGSALTALARDEVHGVVVHGPRAAVARRHSPVPVRRWHFVGWQVGLAGVGAVPEIEEICDRRVPVVQRDSGASSQQALHRAARRVGASGVSGPMGDSHLDAARRAAHGDMLGLTMEAAAHAFSLSFRPLEHHVVELWLATRWADTPDAGALIELLNDSALTRRLSMLPGYDVHDCGTEREVA
jgi:transcriptional regulator with XRE-family HTH domain